MASWETSDPAVFIDEAHRRGVVLVIVAWQDEWGQVPDQAAVEYRHLRLVALVAYAAGTVLRCTAGDSDRATLVARLRSAGFTVEERARNLVR